MLCSKCGKLHTSAGNCMYCGAINSSGKSTRKMSEAELAEYKERQAKLLAEREAELARVMEEERIAKEASEKARKKRNAKIMFIVTASLAGLALLLSLIKTICIGSLNFDNHIPIYKFVMYVSAVVIPLVLLSVILSLSLFRKLKKAQLKRWPVLILLPVLVVACVLNFRVTSVEGRHFELHLSERSFASFEEFKNMDLDKAELTISYDHTEKTKVIKLREIKDKIVFVDMSESEYSTIEDEIEVKTGILYLCYDPVEEYSSNNIGTIRFYNSYKVYEGGGSASTSSGIIYLA